MINLLCNLFFASLNSTLFFIVLQGFKGDILKYIGAKWYYYLWFTLLIPWVSIWLPFNFSFANLPHFFVFNFFMPFSYSAIKTVVDIWLLGALLALFYISFSHVQFMLKLKDNSAPLNSNQMRMVKHELKNNSLIPLTRIYLSPLVNSPMICHVIHSRIYLPINFFSHYNASEKSYVLHHECIHFQRCDLLANVGMIILLCLNWFNPLLWCSYKYFRGAQELSCDALLSQQYSMFNSKSYSYALLKTAVSESAHASLHCPWNMGNQLKERCLALKLHKANPVKNLIGTLLVVILSGIALAAPGVERYMIFPDLRISNFSNYKLVVRANYECVNKLAEVDKNSVTVISQASIQQLCSKTYWPCTIVFYLSNNCSGEPFASAGLSSQGAITTISIRPNSLFNISGKDYNLLFYGHFIPDANRNNIAGTIGTHI